MTSLIYEDRVKKEWIDYNGHMSEAFYVLVFGYATDAFLDHIGLDETSRQRHGISAYTVEAHIRYLDQARDQDPLLVRTLLAGHDAKRAHLFHTMHLGHEDTVLATEEILLLSVNTHTNRVCPFNNAISTRLLEMSREQAEERPKDLGRAINLG